MDFKIRASAIGKIMTNPRSKSEKLSKTTQSYLQEWYKEQLYDRRKSFSSKYTDKGNDKEAEAIKYAQLHIPNDLFLPAEKNEQSFDNDFMTGTPDVIVGNEVWDIKCSWDCFTFPLFESQIPNKDYYYQLQGYMALLGLDKAKLVYVLMDMPEEQIEREIMYNGGKYEDFIYSDLDPDLRLKVYEVERDELLIEAIENRVIECREYLEIIKLK